ncbi:hypothetical protein OsI_06354 [Oryza sativa Indica Group]|uniref:Uncharacterized protein n=1 Tax=Oryza sativa subsp. indica TaxID=39946 RepID=B8AE63_ORYSI|nr:hypothetical protein OsI_06354 [Oryza sativa Indica Group]
MGAARLCVGLQAILVMSLLLPPPFLPCVLAGAGPGGELVAGEEKHQGRVFASGISTRSLRILSQTSSIWKFQLENRWSCSWRLFLSSAFAEIVNTYGPKGIRAFDVLVQEENANTILSEFDVYAVVGEQVLDRQADQLRSVSQKYENANKLWAAAISNLENKIKVMKQEQTLLSLEAHGHANAVPELSKMVGAVQALVVQCEDLKLKYYEEMPKRKKLHNIVEETKGAGLQGAVVLSNSMNMGCSHGLPVLARASAGTAGLAAARGAGAVGRAQLSLLPRDDHDCCSHSGAHDLQGSECELTTWSATKQANIDSLKTSAKEHLKNK